jgi:polyhydroxyalkanoate synthase
MGMTSDNQWAQSAQQFQTMLAENFQKAMSAFAPGAAPGAAPGLSGLMPQADAMAGVHLDPAKMLEIQQAYLKEATALWNTSLASGAQSAPPADRRFASEAWSANPVSQFAASSYLLNAKALAGLADAVEGDEKTRARVRFAVDQWLAATSPSNFWRSTPKPRKKPWTPRAKAWPRARKAQAHE